MVFQHLLGLLVLAALFIPLERLFTLRRQPVLRLGWRTDCVHFFLTGALEKVALAVGVGLTVAMLEPVVNARLQDWVSSQPRRWQFVEALVLVELIGYFMHRAFHRVPWLWRVHAVHHSSAQLDWLAAVRVHPLDQALTRLAQFVPLYLLGFHVDLLAGAAGVLGVYAVLLHANVRWRLGPLKWLVATAEFHHWHHAADADARSANFAGLFPVIDVLFGTAYLPSGRQPTGYGTETPVPAGYVAQLAFPFRARRRVNAAETLK